MALLNTDEETFHQQQNLIAPLFVSFTADQHDETQWI